MSAGAPPDRPARMPATVWALGAVSLFTDIGGEMIYPLLPAFLASLPGGGADAVGVVEGVAEGISNIGKPFIGRWSDRVGKRKPFVLLGYGISGAVKPLLGFAGSVFAVGAVRASDRFGKSIRGAPRDALIAGSVEPGRQGRAFALQQAMDHAGAVIGPGLATILVARKVGVSTIFLLSAVPGLLAFLTLLFFVKERSFGPSVPAATATGEPSRAPLPGRLRSYFVILFLFALACSTDALLLLRGAEMGLSPEAVTGAWMVLHVVKVAGNFPGGALADKFGPVRSIIVGWMLYGLVYGGFAFAHGPIAAWALFAAYGLYYGFAEGAEKLIVSRFVTPETRGRAFGSMSFVVGVGELLSSFGAGWLYKHHGAGVAFGSGAVLAILASVLLSAWALSNRNGTPRIAAA